MLCEDGFEVVNFYLKNQKASFVQNGVAVYGEQRRGYFHNYKVIFKIIKESRPDVVISNFNYINPAVLFGKLLGVKHNIAWFHTAYGHARPNKIRVLNKAFYLNLADMVLANSESLQNEMHVIYKVPKHKIKHLPFWTNIVKYTENFDRLKIEKNNSVWNIGCPGRLLEDKNQALVIKALYALKARHQKPIRLYIAGIGPYRSALEVLVKSYNLEEEVVFLGLLNVCEMTEFYTSMDIVVLPSYHEAFGLVFIEAIALGTPVLVSKAFGALDFIDDQKFPLADFSFDPSDISELIYKLELYLKNKGLGSDYFKAIYDDTFEKKVIFNQIKAVILDQPMSS